MCERTTPFCNFGTAPDAVEADALDMSGDDVTSLPSSRNSASRLPCSRLLGAGAAADADRLEPPCEPTELVLCCCRIVRSAALSSVASSSTAAAAAVATLLGFLAGGGGISARSTSTEGTGPVNCRFLASTPGFCSDDNGTVSPGMNRKPRATTPDYHTARKMTNDIRFAL